MKPNIHPITAAICIISATISVTLLLNWTANKINHEHTEFRPLRTVPDAAPPPSKFDPTPFPMPRENPLVLSVPVSAGRMTVTFASWKDMQTAENRLR